jgi:hypothetical protein
MNNKTAPSSLRQSPVKARSGSSHLCPIKSPPKLFCIILTITIWAAGLLSLSNQQGYYLETYLRKTSTITNTNDGEESQLDFVVDEVEKIGMSEHILMFAFRSQQLFS